MNKTRQRTANRLAEQVRDKLKAGQYFRCPLCFGWIGLALVASIGVYVPRRGGKLVPYCLCRQCQSRIARKPDLVNQIESYLSG